MSNHLYIDYISMLLLRLTFSILRVVALDLDTNPPPKKEETLEKY